MVLKTLFIIELTDTEEGGLELVDPSWSAEHEQQETETTTSEIEMHLSDMRSEFSEYSGSRKSLLFGSDCFVWFFNRLSIDSPYSSELIFTNAS
ncbi:unnamed protein product [Cylicostephanus goldi]|uniref:Uncharacterized protein n=1 Tax=Cylicostephanus goldi TaxID=71465 RepID=A0A3P6SLE5_CYLGO|nr:unnamed protein product [Cylicostephanus goldi]